MNKSVGLFFFLKSKIAIFLELIFWLNIWSFSSIEIFVWCKKKRFTILSEHKRKWRDNNLMRKISAQIDSPLLFCSRMSKNEMSAWFYILHFFCFCFVKLFKRPEEKKDQKYSRKKKRKIRTLILDSLLEFEERSWQIFVYKFIPPQIWQIQSR